MKDFRNLKVWEKSHQLSLLIYKATEGFPKHEVYGLTNQMRQTSNSIGAIIAEGSGRNSDAAWKKSLAAAMASTSELENFLLLARDLGYFGENVSLSLETELQELRKMLNAFRHKLKPDNSGPRGKSRQSHR